MSDAQPRKGQEMAEKLKALPGFSVGVRDNSAIRRLILAAPYCPHSQVKRVRTTDGRLVPKEPGPNEVNCQKAGGQWWVECEKLGHDPYWTTKVTYVDEDVVNEEGLVTGVRRTRHEEKLLNVVSVPVSRRHDSGKKALNSIEKKGRRRLKDFGFAEVCQFRNCQNPVNRKYSSVAFGDYCSANHLQRVAADQQGIFLIHPTGITERGIEEKMRSRLARQLREAVAGE